MKQENDPVNPDHYNGDACMCLIESCPEIEYIPEIAGAFRFLIIKYMWRLGKKDPPTQDLGKIIWYLQRWAKNIQAHHIVMAKYRASDQLLRHFELAYEKFPPVEEGEDSEAITELRKGIFRAIWCLDQVTPTADLLKAVDYAVEWRSLLGGPYAGV